MPYFFSYSVNGRREYHKRTIDRKTFAKPTNSTMNRIAKVFEKTGNINMNYAGIAPFNWQMLLDSDRYIPCEKAVETFCELDNSATSGMIRSAQDSVSIENKVDVVNYDLVAETIKQGIEETGYSLEDVYPSIVRLLFTGENENKSFHKQMFWRIFGEIACKNLQNNVNSCTICPQCGMKSPLWATKHQCVKDKPGFFRCVDCGILCQRQNSRQCRCANCQLEFRRQNTNLSHRNSYRRKSAS